MNKILLSVITVALLFLSSGGAWAAVSIPFTVNLSENVTVDTTDGTPRIAVDVGGITRYAAYTSGSGTNALVFTYAMVSGDVDLDGVALSSPISLNGGTIKDTAGNDATLTFTVPNTSGVIVNAAVPSGYTVAFAENTATNANKTSLSFSLTYPKANKTLNYSISSSGGGAPITGAIPTLAGTTTVNSINATTLPDGKLTLSAYLTDTIGGTGSTVTDIIPMAILDASLVGHWTFDAGDISGTTAYDRSGQNNNGTLTNNPTQTTGQVGGALNFSNVNSKVVVPDSNTLDLPTSLTTSIWIKPTASYVGYATHPINKWTNTTDANYVLYYFGTTSGTDRRLSLYANLNGVWLGNIGGSYVSPIGSWFHIAHTYNSVSGGKMYVNGVLVTSTSGGTLATNNAALQIGSAGFPGNFDDVRIYNRALTSTEITTLYNATH